MFRTLFMIGQLQLYSCILLSVCFMVFAFKSNAQERLAALVNEEDREKVLTRVTMFMAGWISLYLALHVVRSVLTFVMYSRVGPTPAILAPIAVLEFGCLGIDIATVTYFSKFYHK